MLAVKLAYEQRLLGNAAIEEELSQKVQDMVKAINDRSFNPRSHAWRGATGDFVASTCFAEIPPKTTNLEDFLHYMDLYTSGNPKYRLRVRDTAVTLNEKATKAAVYVNFSCLGSPVGTIRYSVGLLECEKMLGRWFATKYQCLPGVVYEDAHAPECGDL